MVSMCPSKQRNGQTKLVHKGSNGRAPTLAAILIVNCLAGVCSAHSSSESVGSFGPAAQDCHMEMMLAEEPEQSLHLLQRRGHAIDAAPELTDPSNLTASGGGRRGIDAAPELNDTSNLTASGGGQRGIDAAPELNDTSNLAASGEGERPCLCMFDVDRTLTGSQGHLEDCPGNQELPIDDTAYGGGKLTLSLVGQGLDKTFCSKCFVGIVTAGDCSGYESEERILLVQKLSAHGKLVSQEWSGPSRNGENRGNCSDAEVSSTLVTGCNDGTKQYAVAKVVKWLETAKSVSIAAGDVWHFDDRINNVLPFIGTGFNARQVSCESREYSSWGAVGQCGAAKSELVDTKGIFTCPDVVPCLCVFDVDRTLTGNQGHLQDCPANQELPVNDTAYDGGKLTLSSVGQSLGNSFCSKCYTGIVTAGDCSGYQSKERTMLAEKLGAHGMLVSTEWSGPSRLGENRANCSDVQVNSTLVAGCNDGTKQYAVAKIVKWLETAKGIRIPSQNVWHFDDRINNILPFIGSGFNARQVSCMSRDNGRSGAVGQCGATDSELVPTKGISMCP